MKGKYFNIESDCFFITERLKEIDPSYYILFNLDSKKFEIHSSAQVKNSYCFTLPYSQLDERTLDFAVMTRRENRDNLIREIEDNNRKVYEKNIKEQVDNLKEALCW